MNCAAPFVIFAVLDDFGFLFVLAVIVYVINNVAHGVLVFILRSSFVFGFSVLVGLIESVETVGVVGEIKEMTRKTVMEL